MCLTFSVIKYAELQCSVHEVLSLIMAASTDAKPAHSLLKKKRTSDVLSSENANVDFASLMLSPPVEKGLTSAGFERPSPIQLKAIPLGRCGLGDELFPLNHIILNVVKICFEIVPNFILVIETVVCILVMNLFSCTQ